MYTNYDENREGQLLLHTSMKFDIAVVIQFLFVITNDLKYLLEFRIDRSCQKEIIAEENILTFAVQNLAEAQQYYCQKG